MQGVAVGRDSSQRHGFRLRGVSQPLHQGSSDAFEDLHLPGGEMRFPFVVEVPRDVLERVLIQLVEDDIGRIGPREHLGDEVYRQPATDSRDGALGLGDEVSVMDDGRSGRMRLRKCELLAHSLAPALRSVKDVRHVPRVLHERRHDRPRVTDDDDELGVRVPPRKHFQMVGQLGVLDAPGVFPEVRCPATHRRLEVLPAART